MKYILLLSLPLYLLDQLTKGLVLRNIQPEDPPIVVVPDFLLDDIFFFFILVSVAAGRGVSVSVPDTTPRTGNKS